MSCGCQGGNVKYATNNPTPSYTVPPAKNRYTTSCDSLGNCNRIESNEFTVSEGGKVTFNRQSGNLPSNFPKEQFSVYCGTTAMSAIGLRQLAEECAKMADELDGFAKGTTDVVMHQHVHAKVKSKKRKAKRKNKKTVIKKA